MTKWDNLYMKTAIEAASYSKCLRKGEMGLFGFSRKDYQGEI